MLQIEAIYGRGVGFCNLCIWPEVDELSKVFSTNKSCRVSNGMVFGEHPVQHNAAITQAVNWLLPSEALPAWDLVSLASPRRA